MNQEQPGPARRGHGNRKPAATIYDIARHLGLSPSTVSRALNKPGRVNAKTEQRIREAAAALNYRTNPMARALPTGRTNTLGLILTDITNPVYFTLVRGAERVAAAAGYTLVIAESQESGELEAESAERLLQSVDGLVLVASRLDDASIGALAERKPLVLINRVVDGVPGVVPDVVPGIRDALDHLAVLGHTSLAYLSGPSVSWMSRVRWETLLDEAPRRGMTIVEIGPGAPTLDGGQEGFRRVRASGVSAVVAYNDLMAIGLLRACRCAGVDVPSQLSIVGFDDIFGSDFTSPPITTIRTPLDLAGEEAVHQIVAALSEGDVPEPRRVSAQFVRRESTAAPGRPLVV
ncbi:LacI family DNA-binding transcriptional regulator [Phytohabitans aurantiacus]|uniref:LacI family transcriptional regulator n=1 Tax=Phytohabitans aurantiacus TaxID=3016789 RepID=A0ABQ5R080_9ACTN|nr:LacI family DNA-binding transcriptional regulator [Phytohabitans aurantiacus]GLI00219.1 LacI family transcriptional regulator [Phytohabitans aurantiacus]